MPTDRLCSPTVVTEPGYQPAGLHRSVTGEIIAATIEVHRTLGPRLLESAYQAAICRELAMRKLDFVQQVDLPMSYKGVNLDCGYRVDLIVRGLVVVELKAVRDMLQFTKLS
jgi:GxxExxY protein